MRMLLIACFALAAMSVPALAETVDEGKIHTGDGGKTWVVKDSVENCSMLPHKPGEDTGLTILGDEAGYDSEDAADKAMRDADCAGIVE